MIGDYIGSPIGTEIGVFPGEVPAQQLNIFGYILLGDDPCYFSGNMSVKMVQGDDIVLALKVKNLAGEEIDYGSIFGADWSLRDLENNTVLTKTSGDGIEIDDQIYLTLQESDTAALDGIYKHEFTLFIIENSTVTVLENASLIPAKFYVRSK